MTSPTRPLIAMLVVAATAIASAQSATADRPKFDVVQEQLGLRLEAGRVPTPTLVIDSIARPTAG